VEFADSGNLDAQVDGMSRRLLALTWMMPPLIFPRSLQISRALRAMAERGWEATVVAVPPAAEPFAAQDPRLAEFYGRSYQLLYVEPREEVVPSAWWLRILRKVLRTQNLTAHNWIRRATKFVEKRIEAEAPDALVSFAQPWINHVVALRIKRHFPDLPWVAHFSDPWVDSPYFNPAKAKERDDAVKQERAIIAAADAVIFTTRETADLVMAKYPPGWAAKVHVVGHGFDSDLLALIRPYPRSEQFTITHTGNLYEKREPFALLRALTTLRAEMPAPFKVDFVGHATQAMRDMVENLELSDIVSLAPGAPFLDSLAIAQSADLLLVIDAPAEHSVFLPSKIVDYLALHRPILALTPPAGASARVLGGLGFPTVDPTDEAGILAMLREVLQRWQRGEGATEIPPAEALRKFDIRETVTGFEAAIMSAMASKGQSNA
jgi:hypothetical protein